MISPFIQKITARHKGEKNAESKKSPQPAFSFPFRLHVNFGCPTYGCILLVGCCTLRLMTLFYLQMMSTQKEIQKQMNSVVSAPVNKEGKRLEASLGRSIEKVVKANSDALWARFQEENAKHEKLERDRMQQITNLITNTINKDLPAILEKTLKKEIAAVGPAVARAISPTLEKNISSAIMESFQVRKNVESQGVFGYLF